MLRVKTVDKGCMTERRMDPRALCADLVTLEWRDEIGQEQALSAVLEDISASGACLQVESAVPTGIVAAIRHHDWTAPCKTAYCAFREIGYYIGVQFADGARWSKVSFEPRHLLDLGELTGGASRPSKG